MTKTALRPLATAAIAAAAFMGGLATQARADQPYMHQALDQLRAVRATLAAGASDKGGHRVRAMALVDQAAGEVRAAIGFERTH